jgi:hypothetical protein
VLEKNGIKTEIILVDSTALLEEAIISGKADLWIEFVPDGQTCDKYDYYNSAGTINKTGLNDAEIDALTASRQISADRSRISHYLAKKNLGQTARIGTTYFDSMKFEFNEKQDNIVESREQAKSEDSTITASAIDRWGVGFTEADYKNLDEHYRMLKKNNPNADNNQEIFIKSLCNINMLMVRALKDGDSDKYVKLTDQYAKTFKQAGLRTVEEKDASNDETFCMTLGFISDYTPEEFYQNKELYVDFDKIGEYMERHILRPMINLETGSDTRDSEFYVPEVDDYEEE